MRLRFSVEPFAALLPAILFYEKAHADEVGYPDGRINIRMYEAIERAGQLLCIAVRGDDGFIYGYHVLAVGEGPNSEVVQAETKLLYLDTAHRPGNFRPLEHFTRQAARDRGAKILYTGLRIARQQPLFERLGYRQAEVSMRIDL